MNNDPSTQGQPQQNAPVEQVPPPQPIQTTPVQAYTPTAAPYNPVAQPLQAAPQQYTPAPQAYAPPKKKNFLWLWITIGVIVLLIAAAVITFFVAVSNADSTAKEYTNSAKTYLDDVYDAAIGTADSPADILTDIKKVKAPTLEDAFLGDFSDSYKEAKELRVSINKTVSATTSSIDDIQKFKESVEQIETYTTSIIKDESALVTALRNGSESGFKTALDSMVATCDKLETTVSEMKKPGDMTAKIDELKTNTVAVCSSIDGIMTAFNQKDTAALRTSLTTYSTKGSAYNTSHRSVNTDAQNTGTLVKDAAKPIQKLSDSL
jgi:flagellar basal body-associated protein FliL